MMGLGFAVILFLPVAAFVADMWWDTAGRALYRRRPARLPTGWRWVPTDKGASLVDRVGGAERGFVQRVGSGCWATSRGTVEGDMIDAMRHVEHELQVLGWESE